MMSSILRQTAAPSFLSSQFAPLKAPLSTSYCQLPRIDYRSLRSFDRSVATVVRAAVGGGTTPPVDEKPPPSTGHPLFTGKDIPKFYLEQCPKIFPKPGIIGTVEGLVKGPKYDGEYLHQLTRGLLKETRLSQAITGIVIPSFDIKNMQPVVFSSFEAKKKPLKNPLLSDVCISTSAAPTYLPPYYFETKDANNKIRAFNLTDGGVAANNPTMAAISLITREMINPKNRDYPNDPLNFKKFLVISLGTEAAKYSAS